MAMTELISVLGTEIASQEELEEEAFSLFAQDMPSSGLGFVDSRAASLAVAVGDREFTIHQSPAVLSSNREGGTTGAVLWKITPLFAHWLSSPDNPLCASGILTPASTVVELGCGISGILALALRDRVHRYVLTDQPYVSRLVARNIAENAPTPPPSSPRMQPRPQSRRHRVGGPQKNKTGPRIGKTASRANEDICFVPLDWETDDVRSSLAGAVGGDGGVDLVVACDCVYNDALVRPLVDACAEVCALGEKRGADGHQRAGPGVRSPTVCVMAQQLRHADVFDVWLRVFAERFRVWRVPDGRLPGDLRPGRGYVVHVGVLRDAMPVGEQGVGLLGSGGLR